MRSRLVDIPTLVPRAWRASSPFYHVKAEKQDLPDKSQREPWHQTSWPPEVEDINSWFQASGSYRTSLQQHEGPNILNWGKKRISPCFVLGLAMHILLSHLNGIRSGCNRIGWYTYANKMTISSSVQQEAFKQVAEIAFWCSGRKPNKPTNKICHSIGVSLPHYWGETELLFPGSSTGSRIA